ncbi:MAG: hypothetical protein AAF587_14130 [Bacteroidota bacterium]
MRNNILHTDRGSRLIVGNQLGSPGGQGTVYEIQASQRFPNHCVKVYHDKFLTEATEQRLSYMVAHQPDELEGSGFRICWPEAVAYKDGEFRGFVMKKAFQDGISLQYLCESGNQLSKQGQKWAGKFDAKTKKGFMARLQLCTNIAAAIYRIHRQDIYVLVDMNPRNIEVTNDGKVSVLDTDSFQIANQSRMVFHGPVATPEFAPPESARLKPSQAFIPESWDRFSMAIIFYQILCRIHPFVGTAAGEFSDCTDLMSKIRNGLFPFGENASYIRVVPQPHETFKKALTPRIQSLFLACFDSGIHNPNRRPSAQQWGKSLYEVVTHAQKGVKSMKTAPPKAKTGPLPKKKLYVPPPAITTPGPKTQLQNQKSKTAGKVHQPYKNPSAYTNKVSRPLIKQHRKKFPVLQVLASVLGIGLLAGFFWLKEQDQPKVPLPVSKPTQIEQTDNKEKDAARPQPEPEPKPKKKEKTPVKITPPTPTPVPPPKPIPKKTTYSPPRNLSEYWPLLGDTGIAPDQREKLMGRMIDTYFQDRSVSVVLMKNNVPTGGMSIEELVRKIFTSPSLKVKEVSSKKDAEGKIELLYVNTYLSKP